MKLQLLLLLFLAGMYPAAAQEQRYTGRLSGNQEIEMEINNTDELHVTGRYQYKGRGGWLPLKGRMTGAEETYLKLKAFDAAGAGTGSFKLTIDGESLQGTWHPADKGATQDVLLHLEEATMTTGNGDFPNGYYYVGENELKVTVIDDKTLDAVIWISNKPGCTGLMLSGKLSASPRGWTGTLADEYEHGDALVTMRLEDDRAQILIEPKFSAQAACAIGLSPYLHAAKKTDGELD